MNSTLQPAAPNNDADRARTTIAIDLRRPPEPNWRTRLQAGNPRDIALQAALLLLIAAFAIFITHNVAANIARFNLQVGYGFLWRPAGFEIAQTMISYPEGATYFRAFLVALLNTILLAGIAIVFATLLGFAVALARMSSNPPLSGLALAFIETVRSVPLLLQLFFWYFGVLRPLPSPRESVSVFGAVFLNKRGLSIPAPIAEPNFLLFAITLALGVSSAVFLLRRARSHRIRTGHASVPLRTAAAICLCAPLAVAIVAGSPIAWELPRLSGFNLVGGVAIIPEFVAMAVGLSVYGSAFIAELIRGGVGTVGKGQTEAGLSLGLSRWRVYSKIVIPQAFRAVAPPLTGQYVTLTKNSSLSAAIGYPDLMLIFAGTALNQTGQPLEIMGMTMASYLAISLVLSRVGNIVNRRAQLVER